MSLSASRIHPLHPASTDDTVLSVNDLGVRFYTRDGVIRALNDVSFYLKRGETLGIVGESGCGKSVMALSVMGLIPQPPGRIENGTINLEGRNLLSLSERDMRKVRGNEISMIFQEPMTSLNPVLKIGFQISESLMLHQKLSKKEAFEKTVEFLDLVRIPEAAQRMNEYPHQMSGGMRQRVMIAMALSCNPKVLIADEPTTALDVTIQAQILNLMLDLKKKLDTDEVRLEEIPGVVPSLRGEISGCTFAPRCKFAAPHCREAQPPLEEKAPGHWVACWETERVRNASYA